VPTRTKRYGWIPDFPDHRDHVFAGPAGAPLVVAPKVDLRARCPKRIPDQGRLASSTAHAIAAACEFELLRQNRRDVTVSRLFIYYNQRALAGTVRIDGGASIRDGLKTAHKLGICDETTWPYSDKDPGPYQEKPSATAYAEAKGHRILAYSRVPRSLRAMKTCLSAGWPFLFGFSAYAGFESGEAAKTGVVQMPRSSESLIGGHVVLAVGYDDSSQRFIARNSWGAEWGEGGYFAIPYAYLLDEGLADDFWTLTVAAR